MFGLFFILSTGCDNNRIWYSHPVDYVNYAKHKLNTIENASETACI